MTDTIFALATPPGRGAVAVVRVSGPGSGDVLISVTGGRAEPRQATLKTLRNSAGVTLDRALVLWFPGPASFTGEDCAEFHLHGGQAVVDSVTEAIIDLGARLAEPGEFTRRAFENGKLDLTQAEGIADLVDAETSAQARQALDQLEGGLTRRYHQWREALIAALGLLEAAVDFPEDDAASQAGRSARVGLQGLWDELQSALAEFGRGRLVRDGYRIALIGAPNAGKSSLINRLSGRDVAIVNETPGTTRDVLEAVLILGGYRVVLSDTAGLRVSDDAVEAEGTRRAGVAAETAALRLWVIDGSAENGAWRAARDLVKAGDLCLINKADLEPGSDEASACAEAGGIGLEFMNISAASSETGPLLKWLQDRVSRDLSGADFPAATRVRHLELLKESSDHIARALARLAEPELAAEDVRLAARAMGRVTGAIGVEDVLDRVFSTFCIGK